VTVRSDIYALGLVLYEIFTGQRALDGKNLAELINKREQSGIVPPTAIVRDLDPQIERAIMTCLRPDAEERPASALAVAASMPGGDPLAAALAAGETPSPEMVAAAGAGHRVSTRAALLAAAWMVVALAALAFLYQRQMFVNRVSTPKPPEALQDRAIEALARLGYPSSTPNTAWGLGLSPAYARYIEAANQSTDRWRLLTRERPASFYFWYRTSPLPLVPFGSERRVTGGNPPMSVSGMTLIVVDAAGRLSEFLAVPTPLEDETAAPAADWNAIFETMGLPAAAFTPVTTNWLPYVFADERRAWEGRLPDMPDEVVRVEAAAYRGKLVEVVLRGPWRASARTVPAAAPPPYVRVLDHLQIIIIPGLMLAAAVLAHRQVRLGRGDRRGAFRAAAAMFVIAMAAWLFRGTIGVFASDVDRFFAAIGVALYQAGLLWVTYLALEPYIRRYSPDSLIGWTRLVAGQWRDPRVAADVMIGVSAGLAMTVIYGVQTLLPTLVGRPEPRPHMMDAVLLLGSRQVIGYLLSRIGDAVQGAMLCVVGVVSLRLLLKRPLPAAIAAVVCFTPVAINGMFPEGTPVLNFTLGACLVGVLVATIHRRGLLPTVAALVTHFVLLRAPITTDLGSWRGPLGLWFIGVVAAFGLGACYIASARTPRLGAAPAYQPQEL
jgi:hypothetical protein